MFLLFIKMISVVGKIGEKEGHKKISYVAVPLP